MKTTQIIASFAVGAALVLAAGKTEAQIIQKLNISGSLTYQLNSSQSINSNNGQVTTTDKTKKVSFNNNKLISLLNASAQFLTDAAITNIPKNSYFIMVDNDILVTNKNGFVVNLSQTFVAGDPATPYASFSGGDVSVSSGKSNNTTLQSNDKGATSHGRITFNNGGGNTIEIEGLLKFNESFSKLNNSSQQNVNQSGKLSGSGTGTTSNTDAQTENPFGVCEGNANANGNGKQTVVL